MDSTRSVMKVLREAKALAQEYRSLTGNRSVLPAKSQRTKPPAFSSWISLQLAMRGMTQPKLRMAFRVACKSRVVAFSKIRSGVEWSDPLILRKNSMPCY
jgi:hypothetical protein